MLTIALLAAALAGAPAQTAQTTPLPPNTIDCHDWTRTGGVWTSNADAKPFSLGSQDGMLIREIPITRPMTIGGYDLAKTLDRKCGGSVKSTPATVQKASTTQRCLTRNGVQDLKTCPRENGRAGARVVNASGQPVTRPVVVNSSGQRVQPERTVNTSGQVVRQQNPQIETVGGQRLRQPRPQRQRRPRQ